MFAKSCQNFLLIYHCSFPLAHNNLILSTLVDDSGTSAPFPPKTKTPSSINELDDSHDIICINIKFTWSISYESHYIYICYTSGE